MFEGYRRKIVKIYAVIGCSCLLLSASFYYHGFRPLAEELRQEHLREIDRFLDSAGWMLKGVLERHFDLAKQSASRTAIRNKLAAYNEGAISLDELIAFCKPKLADAVNANDEILGITRFDREGNYAFSVGRKLPANAPLVEFSSLQNVQLKGPFVDKGGKSFLLYYSPISDEQHGRVGVDIIVVSDFALQAVSDASEAGLRNMAITRNNEVIYRPRRVSDPAAQSALEKYLAEGFASDNYIIKHLTLPVVNWSVYSVFDRNAFFEGINKKLLDLIVVAAGITLLTFLAAVAALRPIIKSLLEEKRLYTLSRTDALTGISNRLHFEELLERELNRVRRYGSNLSLLMFDADFFKRINDEFGHTVGDEALKWLATTAKSVLRRTDLLARYGGEEFVAILPQTDRDAAEIVARRLRKGVAENRLDVAGHKLSLTVSIGVATYESEQGTISAAALIQAADEALYESKRAGRNRETCTIVSP